jgi:hypothetical protein
MSQQVRTIEEPYRILMKLGMLFGRIYNSSTVNVVWQYLYTMRLSKLKGLTEQDGQDDQMKVWKFASEKFIQTIHKYTKEHLFWKKIKSPRVRFIVPSQWRISHLIH